LDSTNCSNGDITSIGILFNVHHNKYHNHNKLVSNYSHYYYSDDVFYYRNHPDIGYINNCNHFSNNHFHRKLVG